MAVGPHYLRQMLIVLGGLPGVGKTTIARELARRLPAVHIRIDSIEQALRPAVAEMEDWGYRVGYALAEDNLRLGMTVVADSVNPIEMTRAAWRSVAERAGARMLQIEIVCSNPSEHRRRVETRAPDIAAQGLPMWTDVVERQYEPWPDADVVVDTSHESFETITERLARTVNQM
jgi:predicted kinase